MKRTVQFITLLCVASLSLPSLKGALFHTIEEPFDTPQNGLPAGWTPSTQNDAAHTVTITDIGSGDWRLIFRRDGSVNTLNLFYTATSAPVASNAIADFEASVVLRSSGGTYGSFHRGIFARAQAAASDTQGYYAYIRNDLLVIAKDGTVNIDHANTLGVATLNPIYKDTDYLNSLGYPYKDTDYELRFSAVADQLSASLLGKDSFGAYTVLLGSLTVTDSSYTSGYFGLRSSPDGVDRYVTYSDLSVNVIPEPSLAFGAVAMLGWFGWKRRDRKEAGV